jgi:hypothetical protein
VPLGALLGARHHKAPLRQVRQRRPHLLTVDHPLVAVEFGCRRHIGQVTAGAGFRVALAPKFGDVEDLRQEALLLFRRAVGDQRRPEQFLAEVIDLVGRVRAGVLLVERDAVCDRKAPPAVLDRPAQEGKAGGRQMLVPRPSFLERLVLATRSPEAFERGEFADDVVGEPLLYLGPELLDLYHPCRLTYQALALLEEHR